MAVLLCPSKHFRVMAPNLPTSELDLIVKRAFDAESSVVVSVRDAGYADSVLSNEGEKRLMHTPWLAQAHKNVLFIHPRGSLYFSAD